MSDKTFSSIEGEDPLATLARLLEAAGAELTIGLRAQGKFETVMQMRSEQKDWDEIGAAIRWNGGAAQRWFEIESLVELRDARAALTAAAEREAAKERELADLTASRNLLAEINATNVNDLMASREREGALRDEITRLVEDTNIASRSALTAFKERDAAEADVARLTGELAESDNLRRDTAKRRAEDQSALAAITRERDTAQESVQEWRGKIAALRAEVERLLEWNRKEAEANPASCVFSAAITVLMRMRETIGLTPIPAPPQQEK